MIKRRRSPQAAVVDNVVIIRLLFFLIIFFLDIIEEQQIVIAEFLVLKTRAIGRVAARVQTTSSWPAKVGGQPEVVAKTSIVVDDVVKTGRDIIPNLCPLARSTIGIPIR